MNNNNNNNGETLSSVSVVLDENDVKKYKSQLNRVKVERTISDINVNTADDTCDEKAEEFSRKRKKIEHSCKTNKTVIKKSKTLKRCCSDGDKTTNNKLKNKNPSLSSPSLSSPSSHITMPLSLTDQHIIRNGLGMYAHRNDLKYKHLYFVNECNPGGSTSLHCYHDDLVHLSSVEYEEFVNEFLGLVFEETKPRVPNHVMGIVHNAAHNMPDLLEKMADDHPDLIVKRTLMGKSDVETLKLGEYQQMVHSTYSNGTFRCGPLLQVSLVGATSEECGGYFPSILKILESNSFVKRTLPWGSLSCLEGMQRNHSNDGPILWCRYGEQVIPTQDLPKSPTPKKKGINELKNLQYLPRSGESRELFIEDRTKCHADQVGDILDKKTTAAVGILKATHAKNSHHGNRKVKEVVCLDASHFDVMVERLKLDLHEPPMTQCVSWLDGSKLNQLHRQNIKTSTIELRDNDVYFIPRNVIHQFKTTTSCTSVAWHIRLKRYHDGGGCGCGRHGDQIRDVLSNEEKGCSSKIKKSLAINSERSGS